MLSDDVTSSLTLLLGVAVPLFEISPNPDGVEVEGKVGTGILPVNKPLSVFSLSVSVENGSLLETRGAGLEGTFGVAISGVGLFSVVPVEGFSGSVASSVMSRDISPSSFSSFFTSTFTSSTFPFAGPNTALVLGFTGSPVSFFSSPCPAFNSSPNDFF